MVKIFGIIIAIVGVVSFIQGVRAFLGRLKMKENDPTSRFYVGIKLAAGGLAAIFLGLVLYFTY